MTDSSGEYDVGVFKHFYQGYVVLQFEIQNLLPDQLIKDAAVALLPKSPVLQFVSEVKSGEIAQGQCGYAYSIFTFDNTQMPFPATGLKAKMVFTVVEIDSSSKTEQGTYSDEYELMEITFTAKDYIRGKTFDRTEFK